MKPSLASQKLLEPEISDKTLVRPNIVLVPFLAFDPVSMHRLGYGGGYYDRTLQKLKSE